MPAARFLCVTLSTFLLAGAALAADKVGVAMVEIKGKPADAPSPLAWLMGGDGEPTTRQLVQGIRAMAKDPRINACVIRLKDAEIGYTQAQEIGEAISALSKAGKKVHVFAEAYGNVELVLASYGDEVIVQSGGPVALSGMYMEEMYLADSLSWVGVKAELVQVGDYKGANEQMTRNAPSPQWDQNIDQLLDGMYGAMRSTLITNRKLTDAQLDAAMSSIWLSLPEDQIASGLIDSVVDLATIEEHLASRHGAQVQWIDAKIGEGKKSIDVSNPFAILGMLSKTPSNTPTGPAIGVVHISGPIVDGDSSYGGLFGEQSVGSRTIRNALEKARDEKLVKGVVLRIDSPGGSAIASEVIWQGVRRVAEKKPVWVSVGSMAASGGYYIAVAGDKIYMNPSSIVGSIGVVGGKLSMGELYDTLKVRVVSRGRGPGSDIFSSSKPWDDATRDLVRSKMKETYDLFLSRVTAGRKGIDVSKTAEGRLFAAERAVQLAMADEIGSLTEAISDMAASLGIDRYEIVDYPGPMGFDEFIESAFGGLVRSPSTSVGGAITINPMLEMARTIIGPRAWPAVRDAAASLSQLRREPVILSMPRAVIVR
ncbi:MAG: S49 family peptidase [Phycisphaeraceae bacterium]|nr:S49 family peptidase [Phycisphaeraceae bacterium]MCW5769813.1 S49 family peptidase [Phycisphaeraceae bacterium]